MDAKASLPPYLADIRNPMRSCRKTSAAISEQVIRDRMHGHSPHLSITPRAQGKFNESRKAEGSVVARERPTYAHDAGSQNKALRLATIVPTWNNRHDKSSSYSFRATAKILDRSALARGHKTRYKQWKRTRVPKLRSDARRTATRELGHGRATYRAIERARTH